MLDETDRKLMDWISGLPGAPAVRFEPPRDDGVKSGIGLYLMDLRQTPPERRERRSIWRFHLRYLVTASGPDLLTAHALLGQVLTAAVSSEEFEFEVELNAPPLELWRALGARPQPAFVLAVPCHYQKEFPKVPLVREVAMDQRPLAPIVGQVVGPGDIPIVAARVEIEDLGLSTSTDPLGRFLFPGAPAGLDLGLRISAKGVMVRTSVNKATEPGRGIIVRLAL